MVRSFAIGCVMLAGLAACAMAAPQQGVDLAQLAGWDIVVADDAIPSELYAAQEFRSIFAQASGIELPIVNTTDRSDRHVLIGASKPLSDAALGFDVAAMGSEELRIVVRDKLIAIAGGRPRGTLYGVYTFLEDYLGVRFLTADHTHVPKLSASSCDRPAGSHVRAAAVVSLELLRRDQSVAPAGRALARQHGRRRREVRRYDRPVADQPHVRQPDPTEQVRPGASGVLCLARRQAASRAATTGPTANRA